MKIFLGICITVCIFFNISGYCQQEKTVSAFEAVEKIWARIQQIQDGENIKNATGTITITMKLNDSDYSNLKSISEKIIGKIISNPVKVEGKFISLLPAPGGKFEKFMMAGKSDFGNFYLYRNFDDITIVLPEMSVEIQDKISEIRKLSVNKGPEPPSEFIEGFGLLLSSVSFKTLFNQGKFWFYDAKVSSVEKAGKKFIELAKAWDGKEVKIIVFIDNWSISQIVFSDEKATITANYKTSSQKVSFIDYMPESIVVDTVDKGNTIKIELGSLIYNKNIDDSLFNLKKMKLSEFISSAAIKLMISQ